MHSKSLGEREGIKDTRGLWTAPFLYLGPWKSVWSRHHLLETWRCCNPTHNTLENSCSPLTEQKCPTLDSLTQHAFQRWSTSLIFIFKDFFFNLKRQMAIAYCTSTRSNHFKLPSKNCWWHTVSKKFLRNIQINIFFCLLETGFCYISQGDFKHLAQVLGSQVLGFTGMSHHGQFMYRVPRALCKVVSTLSTELHGSALMGLNLDPCTCKTSGHWPMAPVTNVVFEDTH